MFHKKHKKHTNNIFFFYSTCSMRSKAHSWKCCKSTKFLWQISLHARGQMELAVPDWCLPFQLWYLYSNHSTRKAAHLILPALIFPWQSAALLCCDGPLPVVLDDFLPPFLSDTFLAGLAALFKVSIKAKPYFCSPKMYDLGQFRLYFYSILAMMEPH